MCSIAGYLGKRQAVSPTLTIMRELESRGYDSAGLVIVDNTGKFGIMRELGSVKGLEQRLSKQPLFGYLGIGHTRWATHGQPDVRNCHPHVYGKVAVVHNGMIDNYQELKQQLIGSGSIFQSETDTEVIAVLLDRCLNQGMSPEEAVRHVVPILTGSLAIAVVFEGYDNLLIVARRSSPLVIGFDNDSSFVGSDASALTKVADRILHLEDGDMGVITREGASIYDAHGVFVERLVQNVEKSDIEESSKGDFAHYMLKEIHEQPRVLDATFSSCIDLISDRIKLPVSSLLSEVMETMERLLIVGCGTAWIAGFVAKYWLESLARIPVQCDVASEFVSRRPPLDPGKACIAVSQSGETADTKSALEYVTSQGLRTLAIVNVKESAIARAVDAVLYTPAGKEIGVASTKAFTTQLAVFACLTIALARQRGKLTRDREDELMAAIHKLPALITQILGDISPYQEIAKVIKDASSVFYLGRGSGYPIAIEGALKLKEISYIHAEAYPAGELKHGPIALIDREVGTPFIVLAPSDETFDKIANNLQEIAARGAKIIVFSSEEGCAKLRALVTCQAYALPSTDSFFNPILYAVAMQLVAYYTAVHRGKDVDRPRNLAKSVTVE